MRTFNIFNILFQFLSMCLPVLRLFYAINVILRQIHNISFFIFKMQIKRYHQNRRHTVICIAKKLSYAFTYERDNLTSLFLLCLLKLFAQIKKVSDICNLFHCMGSVIYDHTSLSMLVFSSNFHFISVK